MELLFGFSILLIFFVTPIALIISAASYGSKILEIQHDHFAENKRELLAIIFVWLYAVSSYLLCVFIKGCFFDPFKIFKRHKPISLFDHKS